MDQEALREFARSFGDNEKRFIMFDQSGDRGRIMVEPNRFFEFDPRSPPTDEQPEAAEFHRVYREALASFQRMREASSNPVTLCHLGDVKDSDSSMSKLSWDQHPDDEQQSSVRGEDSDDIDALLYSDDDLIEEDEECSTGHTPLSEVTREESDEITSSYRGDDVKANDEVEEEEENKEENDEGEGEAVAKVDKACKWSGYSGQKRKQQPSVMNRQRKEAKKHRKERIRRTVRTLQNIVPGGDSMDPAVVLDEAIVYMKVLQMRVRQLEASRQQDLSNARA